MGITWNRLPPTCGPTPWRAATGRIPTVTAPTSHGCRPPTCGSHTSAPRPASYGGVSMMGVGNCQPLRMWKKRSSSRAAAAWQRLPGGGCQGNRAAGEGGEGRKGSCAAAPATIANPNPNPNRWRL